MSQPTEAEEFKNCCADFYADEWVRRILGDSFHPGGMDLTRELLERVETKPGDRLLDVAAGQGTSTLLAAEAFGARVTALDLSAANLHRAEEEAARRGLQDLITTRRADAERLPFEDGSFDVILCECAFCTFVDKEAAAAEMARVLSPGGRLALSDMVLDRPRFPIDLDSLLTRVACIADALPGDQLVAGFSRAGFANLDLTDAAWALTEMVGQIRERLLSVELLAKLKQIDIGSIDLLESKRLIRRSTEIIGQGIVGYACLTGTRKRGG